MSIGKLETATALHELKGDFYMKKLLSIILCLAMVFSLSATVFAAEPTIERTVTNEYEAILLLQESSPSELSEQGYSESEINTIQNADSLFDEHIALLATLPDTSLTSAGYTDEQIIGIKSYNANTATTSDKARLSAQCETTSYIDNYTGTTGRVTSKFVWNGIPAFKMKDILITAWNNWQITGKAANVKYTHIYGTQPSFWQAPTYQTPEGGMTSYGSGYYYPAALQDNYFYASEGYSIFVLSRQSSSHLETIARVSHQQGIASLSFSISSGFDIGLSLGRTLLGDGHDERP